MQLYLYETLYKKLYMNEQYRFPVLRHCPLTHTNYFNNNLDPISCLHKAEGQHPSALMLPLVLHHLIKLSLSFRSCILINVSGSAYKKENRSWALNYSSSENFKSPFETYYAVHAILGKISETLNGLPEISLS